jgi:hypothetical protein
MKYAVEITLCGMMYITSLMMIGTGVQAILRSCLNNLGGCDTGTTDGTDLCSTPLKYTQVYARSFIKYFLRYFKVVRRRGLNIKTHIMMIS